VKEVQDYYFKKAKKEGYPARSVYKLEEAQQKHRLLHPGHRVLDLGCHPGSWSLYAAKVVGSRGLVVGIDLQKTTGGGQKGLAPIYWLHGDITDEAMLAKVREKAQVFDVVLSDMAPRTTGNKWADQQQSLALARRSLAVAERMLASGGNFYCKVFEGEDVRDFISEVQARFGTAKVVKPKSSRSESREIFVLGMNFLPAPQALATDFVRE